MRKELTGLTGLRFLAAFYVFVFHIHLRTPLSFLPPALQTFISTGALGVSIFFVLSGFILTYAHLKDFPEAQFAGSAYYGRFLLKRLARIYPAYLVGLLVSLGVSYWLHALPSPTVIGLDATMLQSYVPALSMQWYGSGAWSVSTEFFFYLLFPLLLPVLLRLSRLVLAGLLVVMVLLSSGPGLAHVLHPGVNWESTYTFPPARLAEFVSGIVLGILVLRYNLRVSGYVALALLGIATLYLMKFGTRFEGYTVHHAAILPAILATITVLAQGVPTGSFSWLGGSLLRYLGQISYCFYIMQIPLLILLEGLVAKQVVAKTDFWVGGVLFIVNLLLAAILYALVEKPAHKLIISRIYQLTTNN